MLILKCAYIIFSIVFFTSSLEQKNTDILHPFSPLQTLINSKYDGTFNYRNISALTSRTQIKQIKLYTPITDVISNRTIFNRQNIERTLISYYSPVFSNTISLTRFHFISDDKKTEDLVFNMDFESANLMYSPTFSYIYNNSLCNYSSTTHISITTATNQLT